MTPESRTLLAFAGVHPQLADPARAALVLIDFQREYTEGRLPLDGVAAAVEEAGRLLAFARRAALPVVHVVHHARPGAALFDPAGPLAAIVADLTPAAEEAVVVKGLPNGFAGTDLDARLRATGRTELILAGFATHMCVSTTVRAGLDLGWRMTVVAGACATRALPDPLGGPPIAAATLHRATLAALADRFATVVPDTRTAWG